MREREGGDSGGAREVKEGYYEERKERELRKRSTEGGVKEDGRRFGRTMHVGVKEKQRS